MQEEDLRILKAITQYSGIAMDIAYKYGDKLFLDYESRIIAKPIIEYIKAYKAVPTKRTIVEAYSNSPEIAEKLNEFWDELDNVPDYNEPDYSFDLEKLKERYSNFTFENLKSKIESSDLDEASQIKLIENTLYDIKAINKVNTFTDKTLRENLSDFTKQYAAKAKNPELGKGILTGYSYLDYIKNGLRPADLVIIAGESGTGKSMFLNNLALNMWKQSNTINTKPENFEKGYNIVYFSLEMPHEDCFRRTMASLADVPDYHLRDAKLTKVEAQAVKKTCEFIKNYPWQFDIIDVPRGMTVEDLELHFERIKTKYRPDAIFIDYLTLMADISDDSDWLKMGEMASRVHEFARYCEIPVITAVQLNRLPLAEQGNKKENEAKRIGMHRIGRSALIATHATLIIQIEDRRINEENLCDFKYHVVKNRYGESGKHASITKNFSHCSIKDVQYDVNLQNDYTFSDDISEDVSDIMGSLDI